MWFLILSRVATSAGSSIPPTGATVIPCFGRSPRRVTALLLAVATVCIGPSPNSARGEGTLGRRSPNIVLIFTDDQGYGDLSCFGGKHVETPEIDRLAEEGTRLTSFYVAAPLCSPSRAALMTGCYPRRVGMATGSTFAVLLAGDRKGLHPDEITIAEILKKAGYATGLFGKWHLGDQPDFLPTRQGFDEYFGIPYSHDIHPFHPNQERFQFPPLPLLEGERVVEVEPNADYLTRRFTERAVAFIEKNRDRPFFLYLAHPIPHVPLHVSPPFMKDVPEEVKKELAREDGFVDYRTRRKLFRQAIEEVDWSVGQIVAALRKRSLDRDTLVVFTSDNGPAVGSAGPFRGRKGSTFEGGMRVPAVAWWPGKIRSGGVCDELLTAMDLLPTFANLAGAAIPDDRVIDGKDIWPVLAGRSGEKSPHDRFFYHAREELQAVRSGPWKLHLARKDGRGNQTRQPALYHLDTDKGETRDVAAEHPEIVERLQRHAVAFEKDLATNSRRAAFVDEARPLAPHETKPK